MYERILVPLDGSERSQAVLTHLANFFVESNAEIVPLTVVEHVDIDAPEGLELLAGARARARAYSDEVVSLLEAEGLRARGMIREGDPATQILEGAAAAEVDLIAMASHGHTGLSRLYFGSVAERVIRQADAPVLVVKSFTTWEDGTAEVGPLPIKPLQWKTILVPLDGSTNAEVALPRAIEIARAKGASIILFRSAPTVAHGGFYGLPANVPLSTERERSYLDTLAARVRDAGVPVRTAVGHGAPAEVLRSFLRETPVDLIVMTTHGRTGVRRWLLGSVAETLLRSVHVPILLKRVPASSDDD